MKRNRPIPETRRTSGTRTGTRRTGRGQDQNLRILVVQETEWITRFPHTQHHLFEQLSLRGHEVRVIDYGLDWKKEKKPSLFRSREVFPRVTKIYDGSTIDVIRPAAIHVPVIEYFSLIPSHAAEIARQIRTFRPDVIVGFGILNTYVASVLARQSGIPFIYYWIDALDTLIPEPYFRKFGRAVERRTIANSEHLFVTNEKLRGHLVQLGADPGKIEVAGHGIDLSRFTVRPVSRDTGRKPRPQNDKVVLVFMGWLYHFSGLKELAIRMGTEREKYKKCVLCIVGDGDAYDELAALREQYGLADQLILAGRQPYAKIPEYIAGADVCILPAYPDEKIMQDIMPIKILEYMAMAKPVVTTRLPGIMKECGMENGVFYVNTPGETLDMAKELAASKAYPEYCAKARQFVQARDWNVITGNFESSVKGIVRAAQSREAQRPVARATQLIRQFLPASMVGPGIMRR